MCLGTNYLFNICNIANVKYDRHKQDIVGQFQMHLYPPGLWGSEGTVQNSAHFRFYHNSFA